MSNMGGPPPDDSIEDKKAEKAEEGENTPHLSLADIIAPIKRDIGKSAPRDVATPKVPPWQDISRENAGRANQTQNESGRLFNVSDDSPEFYDQQGGSAAFDILEFKSEFKTEEKPPIDLNQMVDQFLENTKITDDFETGKPKKPDKPDNPELHEAREELATADNVDDIIEKALRLAKLYEHLNCVEEAKKAVALSLGIDPNNQQARELFKNLEHVQLPDLAVADSSATNLMLSRSALRHAIRRLSSGKVIVVGDLLIDELLEGLPERISREAPVLILEHVDTELHLGGAGNAAHNVAALGGQCYAVGVCGADIYAGKLGELLEQAEISYDLVEDPTRPTTIKTRILSRSHALKQQLLRLDRISHHNISASVEQELIKCLKNIPAGYGAIVLSDYTCGAVTDNIITACKLMAQDRKLIAVVDAQKHFERFQGFSLLTPNQPDTERMVGFRIVNQETLRAAGRKLLDITSAEILLLTRGADGMVLFEGNKEPLALPAFNRSEVFDVTGAGDTVVAAATLALVTGSSPVEAMAIGNLAASMVVKKSGAAVTSQEEMMSALELLSIPD